MKKIFALCLGALCTPVFASYELLLVVDQLSDSIRRYDPVTGASLGSFGGLQLTNPQSIAIIPGTSECVVTDPVSDTLNRFNYSTGQPISSVGISNSLGVSPVVHAFTDGTFLLWSFSGSVAQRISAGGTLLNTFSVPAGATSMSAAGVGPSNEVYIAWNGTNRIQRYASNGALQGQSAVFAGSFGAGAQMSVAGNYGYLTSSSNRVTKFTIGNPATALENVPFPAGEFTYGTARGHGDLTYFSGVDNADNAQIWIYDGATKHRHGQFSLGAGVIPVSMATVVAPEPTTMLVLSGGLAILLRRRKR